MVTAHRKTTGSVGTNPNAITDITVTLFGEDVAKADELIEAACAGPIERREFDEGALSYPWKKVGKPAISLRWKASDVDHSWGVPRFGGYREEYWKIEEWLKKNG